MKGAVGATDCTDVAAITEDSGLGASVFGGDVTSTGGGGGKGFDSDADAGTGVCATGDWGSEAARGKGEPGVEGRESSFAFSGGGEGDGTAAGSGGAGGGSVLLP